MAPESGTCSVASAAARLRSRPGHNRGMGVLAWGGASVAVLALVACTSTPSGDARTGPDAPGAGVGDAVVTPGPGEITLAFAGDVHFEAKLRRLLPRRGALWPIARTLRSADVA